MNHPGCVSASERAEGTLGRIGRPRGGGGVKRVSKRGGGASGPDAGLKRLCMAAFAYTGPNCERPLFCSQ